MAVMTKFKFPRIWFMFFFLFSFLLFYCCFLVCFFPLKKGSGRAPSHEEDIFFSSNNNRRGHDENFPPKKATFLPGRHESLFKRLVFVVIDSLRADFIIDNRFSYMTYLSRLLQQGKAIGHYGITHPPTVTLPRIKAMMTGSVPGFIDVVLNFNTKALQEDNLLSQLYRSGKKIIFYGDDTWIKLFPGHFLRHDGTTSFYVTDYTEVDQNVSRHLNWELQQDDWDVMILHYLGLDHIGHLAKPSSPLVEPKLKEMDAIIQKIHEQLIAKNDKSETLMVICGDHGMSDQGSHGGASKKEVTVAVVWLASTLNKKKVQSQALNSDSSVVDQIDITPTIALAFGLPIPQNNLGAAIPEIFLSEGSVKNTAGLMHDNAQQVASVLRENNPKWSNDAGYQLFELATRRHIFWLNSNNTEFGQLWNQNGLSVIKDYHNAIKSMSSGMMTTLTKYDIYGMIFCSISLCLFLTGILLALVQTNKTSINLGLSSTSCFIILLASLFLVCFHVTICTSPYHSHVLCGSFLTSGIILTILMVLITLLISLSLTFNQSIKAIWEDKKSCFIGTTFFLVLGSLLHCVSFMSSSFIEEEHQTWYFLTVTLFIVIVTDISRKQVSQARLTPVTFVNRLRSTEGQTQQQNKIQLTPFLDHKSIFVGAFLIVLCRFQRSWNQTGDKWQHLSDIGDWLINPVNKSLLSVIFLLCLILILVSTWFDRCQQIRSCHQLLLMAALIFIYLFHSASKKLVTPPPWLWNISENGLKESHIVYSLTVLLILETCIIIKLSNNKDGSICCMNLQSAILCLKSVLIVMAALLTSYPHNICVMTTAALQEVLLRILLSRIHLPDWATTFIYSWMAQAMYFYQGHSNSLSSIDVGAAYIGVGTYKPFLVSSLLATSTYSGVIFWYLCLINYQLKTSFQQNKNQVENRLLATYLSLLLSVSFPLPTYTLMVTAQRYHLFVWTVFSPKLLFSGMSYIITSIFVLIVFLLQKLCL